MLPLLFALFTPQVSGVDTNVALARLAIELAAQELAPIPLDADGTNVHGVIYDRLRLGQLFARDATLRGKYLDQNSLAPLLQSAGSVVVAYPLICDGKPNLPQSIQLIGGGREGAPSGPSVRGPAPSPRLPGVTLPPGALVVPFPNLPLTSAIVVVTYAAPACPGTTNDVTLRLVTASPRPAVGSGPSTAKFPDAVTGLPSPTIMRVQAEMGLDGRLRFSKAIGGPPSLATAAEEVADKMRFEPARLNGAPVTTLTTVQVIFSETGTTPAVPPSPAPAAATNSTVTTISTRPIPGLTAADSRCAISDDDTYGTVVANPIKVGGDAFEGPTRERQYLGALRGPTGQGLTFRRIGSLRGPDQTILDRYEITYEGLATPITLYLDEYRFDDPKAPKGLLCGLTIGLTAPAASAPRPGVPAAPPPSPFTTTTDVPNLSAATSQCPVSTDDQYGLSAASAIRMGTGAGAAAREMQYMSALRGPAGEGLSYRRAGAMLAPDRETTVSVFEIVSIGSKKLDTPVRLYFSRLTADDPKAVKGFTCAQAIGK